MQCMGDCFVHIYGSFVTGCMFVETSNEKSVSADIHQKRDVTMATCVAYSNAS